MVDINYPVCCVLGHIDVGKTKFLDKLRNSNVQLKEIGGITQEIGSTFFDKHFLLDMTKCITSLNLDISGLIMIDTPGHDCFTQMRMTGVKIAHLAIVIVDIVKGLEKQTIQCIELLKQYNTNFIIALNKIDKIFGWNPGKDLTLKKTFEKQSKQCMILFRDYIKKISTQLAELEINALPYYENSNYKEYISMVPISAQSGEGLPDLIMMISHMTSKNIIKDGQYNLKNYNYGFILDIKKDDKYGVVYHSIFMNGKIKKGDELLIESNSSLIDITIKDILIPENQNEMKSKMSLQPIDNINITKGIALKFANSDLENSINIGGLFVVKTENNKDILREIMTRSISKAKKYKFGKKGIIINVPSKSMADAVVEIMQEKPEIKIKLINVGIINKMLISKVSKFDDTEKNSVDNIYNKKFRVILDYNCNYKDDDDIKKFYDAEIINFANENDVYIMNTNTVYKLFDKYNAHIEEINTKIRLMYPNIVNNFRLEILPKYVFLKKMPLLMGVKIINGKIKKNNMIMAYDNEKKIILGNIVGIQKNNKNIEEAEKTEVCIKIEGDNNIEFGKHFDEKWKLCHYMTDHEIIIQKKFYDSFK